MWPIAMNLKRKPSARTMAGRELHALTKTYVLLVRDLPFVTNLSEHYSSTFVIFVLVVTMKMF